MPCVHYLRNPSFQLTYALPSELNIFQIQSEGWSHIPFYKTRLTSHNKGFCIFLLHSVHYTRITSPISLHFLSIFCPKGRNHSTITILPSSAPHLENQHRRHSSRNSTSVLLQGFLLLNSMFTHVIYFYVKPL